MMKNNKYMPWRVYVYRHKISTMKQEFMYYRDSGLERCILRYIHALNVRVRAQTLCSFMQTFTG